MKHKKVKFVAWQDKHSFEIVIPVLSATADKQIGQCLSKFFQWFDTMKNFKVDTGFKGREDVYVSLSADGKEVINTKALASRFKAMTKFKLNRGERSKIRFTALMEALYNLALTFDERTTKVSQEKSIEEVLNTLRKQDAIASANRKALKEAESKQPAPAMN